MVELNYSELIKLVDPKLEQKFLGCLLQEIINHIDFKGYECPLCGNEIPMFLPSVSREKFYCPKCGSMDRHRLVWLYLKNYTDIFSRKINLLHFAPEARMYHMLEQCETIEYHPVDLMEGPRVKELVDMCSIPYPDNTFDVIYNSHVLEHIPDDLKAMSELYRCVKPASEGGFVLVMVPLFRSLDYTFENEDYDTDELRLKYFGQEDHVRKYGMDIIDRLESVGFEVEEIYCKDFFDENIINNFGLYKFETMFICKK